MDWPSINQFMTNLKNVGGGICLLLIVFSSCHDKEALKKALIEKTVKEKIATFKKQKMATCRKEALTKALTMADYEMIQAALNKVDTTGRGNRPEKPSRPSLDLPVDTTPIKPLFEEINPPPADTTLSNK